jgi:hypothetical protein
MTTESAEFERRIERIHRVLEEQGVVVTWNDRVPDPDNPTQPRQIDISIRRDDALMHVECRLHKNPQDVKWIEELIGRRASLRASAIIAVSASGFTEGAQAKARQFGIILRNFNTLTPEEIRDWGKKRKMTVIFYRFTEAVITVQLPLVLPQPPRMINPEGKPFSWRPLFEQAMEQLEERRTFQFGATAAVPIFFPDIKAQCLFNGMKASRISFSADAQRYTRDVWTISAVGYADPLDANARKALVGAFDMGKTEIVEASDIVSVIIDLSRVKIPKLCLLKAVLLDMGREVQMREMRVIGATDALRSDKLIQFRFTTP